MGGVKEIRGHAKCENGWDHRRERLVSLVSLVRLSSELALPIEEFWLACDSQSEMFWRVTY